MTPVGAVCNRTASAQLETAPTKHGARKCLFIFIIHHKKDDAHTFWGLCTRLYAKLTAHTLSIYLNHLFKKEDFLQIKQLAFPVH